MRAGTPSAELAIETRGLTKRFGRQLAVDGSRSGRPAGRRLRLPRAPTARARPPPSGCCWAWPRPPAATIRVLGQDDAAASCRRCCRGSARWWRARRSTRSSPAPPTCARLDAADPARRRRDPPRAGEAGAGTGGPGARRGQEGPRLFAGHEAAAGHRQRPAAPRANCWCSTSRPTGWTRRAPARCGTWSLARRGRHHGVRLQPPAGRGGADVHARGHHERRRAWWRRAPWTSCGGRARPRSAAAHPRLAAAAAQSWPAWAWTLAAPLARTAGLRTAASERGARRGRRCGAVLTPRSPDRRWHRRPSWPPWSPAESGSAASGRAASLEDRFVALTGEGFDVAVRGQPETVVAPTARSRRPLRPASPARRCGCWRPSWACCSGAAAPGRCCWPWPPSRCSSPSRSGSPRRAVPPGAGRRSWTRSPRTACSSASPAWWFAIPLFLPLTVGVVAGDTIAGEAGQGTLRYLLVAPAGRVRLLVVKYVGRRRFLPSPPR